MTALGGVVARAMPERLRRLCVPLSSFDRRASGVYLCSRGGVVVYVGESIDIQERARSHGRRFGDGVAVWVLRIQTILRLGLARKETEAALIRYFGCSENVMTPGVREEWRVLAALLGSEHGAEADLCPSCGVVLLPRQIACRVCAPDTAPADYTGFDAAGSAPDFDGEGFEWPVALNGIRPESLWETPGFIEHEQEFRGFDSCDSWSEDEEHHLMLYGLFPPPDRERVNAQGADYCDRGHEMTGSNRGRGGLSRRGAPVWYCRECRRERYLSRRLALRRLVPVLVADSLFRRAA